MTGGGGLAQVLTTVSSKEEALRLARQAVEDRVAACVQIVGPITSVYRWQGDLHEDEEFLCLMKVPERRADALASWVREHHPYDTPEITAVTGAFVDERYLHWAEGETDPAAVDGRAT